MTSSAWSANGKINPTITFHRYLRAASRSFRHRVHLPFSSTRPAATAAATAFAAPSVSVAGAVAVADEDEDVVKATGTLEDIIEISASDDGGDDDDLNGGIGIAAVPVVAAATMLVFRIDM